MSELHQLTKIVILGIIWICDQFVCGLHNAKRQQEILCVPDLTAQLASHKARAAEVVYKET